MSGAIPNGLLSDYHSLSSGWKTCAKQQMPQPIHLPDLYSAEDMQVTSSQYSAHAELTQPRRVKILSYKLPRSFYARS